MHKVDLTKARATELMNEGNEAGLKYFFDNYYLPLMHFALGYVEEQFAEDIVADSFVTIWEVSQKGHKITSVGSYLFAIVRHACISQRRKKKIYNKNLELLIKHQEKTEPPQIFLEQIRFEFFTLLMNEIQNLPPRTRAIAELSFVKGKKEKEIADCLNISPNTVRNTKAAARAYLRKIVPPDYL